MQRFAVSQKNRTEAISISPFSLSLLYRTENKRFSTINCTKTGSTQLKLSAACFVVQSCLADADFVVSSNYCLIGTRQKAADFFTFASGEYPARKTGAPQRHLQGANRAARRSAYESAPERDWWKSRWAFPPSCACLQADRRPKP